MALLMIFMFGIGNFAMHRMAQESGHPVLRRMLQGRWAREIWLGAEFLLLLTALLLAAGSLPEVAFLYALYSAFNMVGGWLLISDRM